MNTTEPPPDHQPSPDALGMFDELKIKMSEVFDQMDMNIDEFQRIEVLLSGDDSAKANEIRGLCNRAITVTRQRVPVIQQRDDLEKERNRLRRQVESLSEALKPFSKFACEPPCGCFNCVARAALTSAV